MNKDKIYTIIFWTSLLVILVWIILKIVGVINSPVWIEMIPYVGLVFAAGSFYQSVSSMKVAVSDLKLRTGNLEKDMIEVKTDIKHFHSNLHGLKARFA